jgi:hypothetical protein
MDKFRWRRGITGSALHVQEHAYLQLRQFLHAVRQGTEHLLSLIDGITGHQNRALRMGKQLADDDTGVTAGDAGRFRARGYQIHNLLHGRSLRAVPQEHFQHGHQLGRRVPLVDHPLQLARHRRRDTVGKEPLHADRSDRRGEAVRPECSDDLAEVAVGEL